MAAKTKEKTKAVLVKLPMGLFEELAQEAAEERRRPGAQAMMAIYRYYTRKKLTKETAA